MSFRRACTFSVLVLALSIGARGLAQSSPPKLDSPALAPAPKYITITYSSKDLWDGSPSIDSCPSYVGKAGNPQCFVFRGPLVVTDYMIVFKSGTSKSAEFVVGPFTSDENHRSALWRTHVPAMTAPEKPSDLDPKPQHGVALFVPAGTTLYVHCGNTVNGLTSFFISELLISGFRLD